jgi:hypothetical protein
MHQLKETVTGEPIGDINGATNTSGVGPANRPTSKESLNPKNQAIWVKRNDKYKLLFANYSPLEETSRNEMAQALWDELRPVYRAIFYAIGEAALQKNADDYCQDVVFKTIKKLDAGNFKDTTDDKGKLTRAFDNFRSYIEKMKNVGFGEADEQRKFIEIHEPVIVDEEGEDEKFYPEDNTFDRGPTVDHDGNSIDANEPPDFAQLTILRSQDDETKKLLDNWEACNFKPGKLAELLSIPGSEMTPSTVSKKISRATWKMRVQELAVILAEQFGESRAKEAAEDILDRIDILCQHTIACYPQTWADALELELRPKVRKVKEDAPKSNYWQAVRHLSRLWSVEKSTQYGSKPLKTAVVIPQPVSPAACHRAFREVVSRYQETSSASGGGLQAINYEKACTSGHATKEASSFVRPSNSDFIADVEICAKQSLTPVELQFFNRCYKPKVHSVQVRKCNSIGETRLHPETRQEYLVVGQIERRYIPAVVVGTGDSELTDYINTLLEKYRASAAVIDKRVRTKLGARLIAVGISPFSEYVREVDVRQPKLKEKLSGMIQTIRACADEFEDESNVLPWPEQNGFDISASAAESYDEYLTAAEVAAILKISTDSVIRKFESRPGVLDLGSSETRFKRRYRVIRIPRQTLERFILESRICA